MVLRGKREILERGSVAILVTTISFSVGDGQAHHGCNASANALTSSLVCRVRQLQVPDRACHSQAGSNRKGMTT